MLKAYTIRASVAGGFAEELKALAERRGVSVADLARHALGEFLDRAKAMSQAEIHVTHIRLPQQPQSHPHKPVEPLPPDELSKARQKRPLWPNNSPLAT